MDDMHVYETMMWMFYRFTVSKALIRLQVGVWLSLGCTSILYNKAHIFSWRLRCAVIHFQCLTLVRYTSCLERSKVIFQAGPMHLTKSCKCQLRWSFWPFRSQQAIKTIKRRKHEFNTSNIHIFGLLMQLMDCQVVHQSKVHTKEVNDKYDR